MSVGYGSRIETDAASLGLIITRIERGGVAIVARHRATRTSDTATLLLHGAAGSWTTWTPMLALYEFENPVLFDLPGWGDATPDHPIAHLPVDTICELVEALADQLGFARWNVVGHSMGGLIALNLAVMRPARVLSVRMVSGTADSVVEAVAHPFAGLRVIPSFVAFRAAMIVLGAVDRPARAVVRLLTRARVLRPFIAPLFRHPVRIDRSIVRALGLELRPASFAAATAAVHGYDVGRWDAITCPVYSTKGDRDAFVRDGDLRGTSTVIADCGHFGNVEHPAEVLAALGLG